LIDDSADGTVWPPDRVIFVLVFIASGRGSFQDVSALSSDVEADIVIAGGSGCLQDCQGWCSDHSLAVRWGMDVLS
jgi:hypothetical protein